MRSIHVHRISSFVSYDVHNGDRQYPIIVPCNRVTDHAIDLVVLRSMYIQILRPTTLLVSEIQKRNIFVQYCK